MKLKFNEIIINTIEIDEELIQEYLDNCKENEILPTKDDFIDYITNNYYISDLVEDEQIEYDLTSYQLTEYLKN